MEVSGKFLSGVSLGALCALAVAQPAIGQSKTAQPKAPQVTVNTAKVAPRFTVDYQWPKPLPTHTLLGSTIGVAVDAQDHVFVVHKIDSFTARTETGGNASPPIGECCVSAEPVLEFDASGKLVNAWGGPGAGYEWPAIPTGIAVDPKGNVWIGGSGGLDGQVLVFTHDGKFVRQIGKAGAAPAAPAAAADTAYQGASPGARGAAGGRGGRGGGRGGRGGAAPSLPPNSAATDMFGGATRIAFNAAGTTAFIADGTRNHRVAVVDVATGAITKSIGAYGSTPSDAAMPAYSPTGPASRQFSEVSCVETSKDGMLYVCDQKNDRIQVFKQDGSFVKEANVASATLAEGSVWDIALSADAAQKYLYVADGMNDKVHILDRTTLTEVAAFGDGGRIPGEFYAVHSIAVDSKGNLFTGETLEGKRVQKFVFGGVAGVKNANEGVLWPVRTPK